MIIHRFDPARPYTVTPVGLDCVRIDQPEVDPVPQTMSRAALADMVRDCRGAQMDRRCCWVREIGGVLERPVWLPEGVRPEVAILDAPRDWLRLPSLDSWGSTG
jgi:hypothetical protein